MRWGEGLIRLSLRHPGGQGEPYGDDVVAQARKLVEETRLTQKEIGVRLGISHMTVSRWARSGGWRRPSGTARSFDENRASLRAMQRHAVRTRPQRFLEEAEGLLDALAREGPDLGRMETALGFLLEARKLHAQGVRSKRDENPPTASS